MNNGENKYYPVFLNVKVRKCVIVGGGEVALRKVEILLGHGAEIKVISPYICPELAEIGRKNSIRVIARGYRVGDLKNAFIAIAATDDNKINQLVVCEARERSVLVNVVDDAENSDFIVPSYLRRGDITIAVSTGGKSPALARKLRLRLESEFGDEYALLVNVIGEVRDELKKKCIKVNAETWQQALDLDSLAGLLKKGEVEKAKTILLDNIKAKQ